MDKITELGLHILASLKADIYHNGDIEMGMLDLMSGTEPDHYELPDQNKRIVMAHFEKQRVLKQALMVGNAAISFINKNDVSSF